MKYCKHTPSSIAQNRNIDKAGRAIPKETRTPFCGLNPAAGTPPRPTGEVLLAPQTRYEVFLIYAGNAKKNAGRLLSSSTRPPFHTIHACVNLHFLPRYVARGSITMLWGGLSLSHCPLLLVGSRKVSLSLNATPPRPTFKARFKMAKACLYGGLVTTHSGRRASSPKASENTSVVASTWLSATTLGEGKGQAHCRR